MSPRPEPCWCGFCGGCLLHPAHEDYCRIKAENAPPLTGMVTILSQK